MGNGEWFSSIFTLSFLFESVSKAIAKGLRMRGIDVTISSGEGLIGVRQSSPQFPTVLAMSNGSNLKQKGALSNAPYAISESHLARP